MKLSHLLFIFVSVLLIVSQNTFMNLNVSCADQPAEQVFAVEFDYNEFLDNPVRYSLEFEGITDKSDKDFITSSEAVCVISRLYAYLNGGYFDKADTESWYDKYYTFALNCGIIKDGEFNLYDTNITRSDLAFLFFSLCQKEAKINEIYFLPDVLKGDEHWEEIFNLYRIGLTDGMDSYGAFMPDLSVNVLQFNTFIKRYLNIPERLSFAFLPLNDTFVNQYDCVLQNPQLPTGCEVTSLTSLLNYYGFDVGKTRLADEFLLKGEIGITDPNVAFVGNPKSSSSYGCFSPVIAQCANSYFESVSADYKAYEATGASLECLLSEVEKSNPVIVWTTMYLVEPFVSNVWKIDGRDVPWTANEHCVVVYGFDKKEGILYVADPLKGNVKYDFNLFNKRFEQLGKQSVIIKKVK